MDVYIPVVGNYFTEYVPNKGEQVYLSPEPDNPTDPHALCVVNINHQKIGYVPKSQTFIYKSYVGISGKIYKYKNGFRIKIKV